MIRLTVIVYNHNNPSTLGMSYFFVYFCHNSLSQLWGRGRKNKRGLTEVGSNPHINISTIIKEGMHKNRLPCVGIILVYSYT